MRREPVFSDIPIDRRRASWINFVKTTRQDFITPTIHSRVCDKHFAPDQFKLTKALSDRMRDEGTFTSSFKLALIPHAIPTIHPPQYGPNIQETPLRLRRTYSELRAWSKVSFSVFALIMIIFSCTIMVFFLHHSETPEQTEHKQQTARRRLDMTDRANHLKILKSTLQSQKKIQK